jgi:apolipoprotein N-acyltransferase
MESYGLGRGASMFLSGDILALPSPYGSILDRVKDEKGQDIFVRGVMTGWVIPLDSRTFYTQYGDWLVWVAFIGSVAFLIVAWRRGMLKR